MTKILASNRSCYALFVVLLLAASFSGAQTPSPQVKVTKPKDTALEELHNIGIKISQAVLAKDIETVLGYDRPDLRDMDRQDLKDKSSDLYCMMFDTSCLRPGRRSVYEILQTAQQLGIKAKHLGSGSDGVRWGLLLFYDRSRVSAKTLRSPKLLCAEDGKKIVSWHFKLADGKWESAHPIFDSATEGLCTY